MSIKANHKRNLKVNNPALAREWHPTKNGSLKPTDVTVGSKVRVWWQCSNGHEWEASVNNRNTGYGCPFCAGRKINDKNCLKTVNPRLAIEWHSTKNGSLTPRNITAGSNKKVWWKCEDGHEWESTVYSRTKGNDCPYCSGRKVNKANCLITVNPKLAKEWHPTKNGGLTPRDITAGSNKKVWWKCKNGHEWEATVYKRTTGRACPYCSGKKVSDDNCLKTVNPRLAEEWHPTKNGSLTPKDVTAGADEKVWWQCPNGHEWEAYVYSRNEGKGCLQCYRQRHKGLAKTSRLSDSDGV